MISVLALLSILVSGVSSFWFTDSHVNSISVNLFHLNSSMYQENINTIEEETYETEIEIEIEIKVEIEVDADVDVEVENLEAVDTDENVEADADETDADETDADETDGDETDDDETDADEDGGEEDDGDEADVDENVKDEGKSENSTLSVEEY